MIGEFSFNCDFPECCIMVVHEHALIILTLYVRCGFPCTHFFSIIGEMAHTMVNVQYWLAYHPYYGSDSKLGDALIRAQAEQFVVEGMGVPITIAMLDRAKARSPVQKYPYLFDNTSEQMYQEAQFVLGRNSTTYGDLDRFNAGDVEDSNDYGSGYPSLATLAENTSLFLSDKTQELHDKISASAKALRSTPSEKQRTDSRKVVVTDVDFLLTKKGITRQHLARMERAMSDVKFAILNDIEEKE